MTRFLKTHVIPNVTRHISDDEATTQHHDANYVELASVVVTAAANFSPTHHAWSTVGSSSTSASATAFGDGDGQYEDDDELSSSDGAAAAAGLAENLLIAVPLGITLYALCFLTFVGNALVLHAIRTDRRLQTVRILITCHRL